VGLNPGMVYCAIYYDQRNICVVHLWIVNLFSIPGLFWHIRVVYIESL